MHDFKRFRQPAFYILTAFWSLLLLANFVPGIPQPTVIIGYLWKVEFALALFLLVSLVLLKRGHFSFFKDISKNEFLWIILPLLAFTAWSGLSAFWAESWRYALHHTLLWACYLTFYLLIRQSVNRPNALNFSMLVTGATVFILSLVCLAEYFSTAPENSGNISLRYSKYAEAIVALLPVFIALAVGIKSRKPFLFAGFALVGWIGITASLGRTQFISGIFAIVAFFALALVFQKRKIRFKRAAVFLALFAAITCFSQMPSLSGDAQQTTLKRFSGDESSRLSFQVRLVFWGVSLEALKQNPFAGIGADNFAVDYRANRERYAETHPADANLIYYEDILPERSHNEFLQIAAELGLVGFSILAWLLYGIARCARALRRKSVSLVSIAALAGMAAFFLSSAVSSYSFRVPANGVCFFFLLALFARELAQKDEPNEKSFAFLQNLKPHLVSAAAIVCLATLIFSAVRGAGLFYVQKALTKRDKTEAEKEFHDALSFDNEDGAYHFFCGQKLFNLGDAEKAIPHLRFAIDKGAATSNSYFYLASAQRFAKKETDANATFLEALRLYPRSVFLLTAYSAFLKGVGEDEKAQVQYEKALQINEKQARSWLLAHSEGTEKLSLVQVTDKTYTEAMGLYPTSAVYAMLDFQRQTNPNWFRTLF